MPFESCITGELLKVNSGALRKKVAREAASLLYLGVEKEYKQAKSKAAKTLGSKFLPKNLEVARELDRIAEENEGSARQERLIQMRKEALRLMQEFKPHRTLLIGSVWRGTIHYDSDIDLIVYHDESEEVLDILRRSSLKIRNAEWVAVTEKGRQKRSLHVHAELPSGENAEIKIVPSIEALKKEKCEIYGDEIKGLTKHELEKVLRENPMQRFLPS